MDISIVFVNYNTISFLTDAIDSVIARTEGIEYEIIVVDNNSDDNSKNILAAQYGDKIIYLSLPENIGFGRANNEGAKIAKGKKLFFLNPDTILLNNAIMVLSDFLDNNPNVGCCGGNLVDKEGKPVFSFARYFPCVFDEIDLLFLGIPRKILYRKNKDFNYTNKPMKVAFVSGANLMMHKNIFDIIKGFDPEFFMYLEETELEYRVTKLKYKIYNVPSAQIIHYEGKSLSNNLDRDKRLENSYAIYFKKTLKPTSIIVRSVLTILNIKLRVLIFTLLGNKEKLTFWANRYTEINTRIIVSNNE